MNGTSIDPITAEVIKNALIYASEEMGIAVRNAAYSPNIKERLDHSCALFDRFGRLVAQAEHIPVHLGSLPWGLARTLETLASRETSMQRGEQWIVNDPYIAGTHLNDITVVRPVFAGDRHIGYAANKAHHADVGGARPGSMSADAGDLFGEGLVLPPMRIVRCDAVIDETIALVRANSRSPEARSGDLRAQLAGNLTGERRMLEVIDRFGIAAFERAVERLIEGSERRLRSALRALGEGTWTAEDFLEDARGVPNIRIRATLTLRDGTLEVDYAGTSPQQPVPINAVFGVTLSGMHYAVRAATDHTIPMNEGCFRPVHVKAALGTLVHPVRPAPVSGGNVETSTRNADVLLLALAQAAPDRIGAQSGGTMSNVLAGGTRSDGRVWTFYETNGCGMGARPTNDGLDAIQCHMTNTMNTPIEAIEREYPLRVERYELVEGTGGAGRHRGGSGLVRVMRLIDGAARFSLLADRHTLRPKGAAGGSPGTPGRHALLHGDAESPLAAKTSIDVVAGDAVLIQTPGGGGYGIPEDDL
ncbi:MAG: hydantoinase B/oxoprolinase family protein [Candidatus Eremiobacteraeota bacterium]|nr:hydantoinase B/oxoprolinase family protein [Candidatus Eremiobacteraeota bacterium]